MSLAKRSVTSVAWNSIANLTRIPIGIVQTIILARYLPIEYFGIYAGMSAMVSITGTFFDFGLVSAFFHRCTYTEDEEKAAAILFTLRFITSFIWAISLCMFGLIFLKELHLFVLLVITLIIFFTKIFDTPRNILIRRVNHKRLAVIQIITTWVSAIISMSIAIYLQSIWALLCGTLVNLVVIIGFLYVWRPIWKPRLSWDWQRIKYFLQFGWRTNISELLGRGLDNIDDLWASYYLGDLSLGYYSKAYKFATYPRTFLSLPVNQVAVGVYAELKNDRLRLSQAFFRFTALLIRTGFLLGGWLLLISPYFIRIFLGERWLPMLEAFRLMLIFIMFDPIKVTIAGVLISVGQPEKVVVARSVQFLILILGLFLLGNLFDIAGVAIAVNLMMFVGIGLLLFYVKEYVDYSIKRLFLAPTIALLIGLITSIVFDNRFFFLESNWMRFFVNSIIFLILYSGIIFYFEKNVINDIIKMIQELWKKRRFLSLNLVSGENPNSQ
jgi:O-antigen/teichoic acid export membrane protein